MSTMSIAAAITALEHVASDKTLTPAQRKRWQRVLDLARSAAGLAPRPGRPSPVDRAAVLALHASGVSQREIAEQLGYSKSAVSRAISAAKQS